MVMAPDNQHHGQHILKDHQLDGMLQYLCARYGPRG